LANYDGIYNTKLVTGLVDSIKKRLSGYDHLDVYQPAAVLDPRFHVSCCSHEEASTLRATLRSNVADLSPTLKERSSTAAPPAKRCRLFNYVSAQQVPQNLSTSAEREVHEYLQQPHVDMSMDPLEYWKTAHQFPLLVKVAATYLVTPATSAPVERLFSIAGKVFRAERCRLSSIQFEALMFLKCNRT
jgi:hypothetical protein